MLTGLFLVKKKRIRRIERDLQHCLPLYPVIFVSPASNLQDSETFPSRMPLAKVCFLWHLDDFSLSTMYTHTEGNRSSRPNVISPGVMSLDTRVTSPAIYLYVARFKKYSYTHFIHKEVAKAERSRVRIVCRSLKP